MKHQARTFLLGLFLAASLSSWAEQQVINVGAAPNDGTGDTLRAAMQKANDNFTELYSQDAAEAAARAAGDADEAAARDDAIADEAAARSAADSAEATARAAADTAEASARASADTTEASARASADTTEASARSSADTTLQANIDAEATARAAADALKAPLASPALTGTPTAPTASAGTSTTQIATTAFVTGGIATATAPADAAWSEDLRGGGAILSNSNLTFDSNQTAHATGQARGNRGYKTGKRYFEVQVGYTATTGVRYVGVMAPHAGTFLSAPETFIGAFGLNTGQQFIADGAVISSSNGAWSDNDIVQIAVDFDAGKIWAGRNNVWIQSGNPATGANPSTTITANQFLVPAISGIFVTTHKPSTARFKAAQQTYAAPSGFTAWGD